MAPGPILSYSGFRAYSECPLRWRFLYVERLPEKPRSFFSFGRSVHSALESFVAPLAREEAPPSPPGQRTLFDFGESPPGAAVPVPPVEELLRLYEKLWVSEGYSSPQEESYYFGLGRELLVRFHRAFVEAAPRPLAVEKDLRAEIEGIPIHGIIDRIDRTPTGGIEILDYKTNKELSRRDAELSDQLTLYQVLVERNYSAPVESLTLYHLRSQSALRTPRRDPAKVVDLGVRMGEAADGIRAGHFEPQPGPWCRWCDFRERCPEFRTLPDDARTRARELVDRWSTLGSQGDETGQERRALEREFEALRSQHAVHRFRGTRGELHYASRRVWRFPEGAQLPGTGGVPGLEGIAREQWAPLLRDPRLPTEFRRQLAGLGRLELEWSLVAEENGGPG
jgi:RecB family exonuclease